VSPAAFDAVWVLVQVLAFVHPIAFQFGRFTVTSYGVMVALGFIAGLWTASRRGLLAGIKSETILDFGPWLIVGAMLGARVLYVTSYWQEQFAGRPLVEIFKVWRGGLVFYGGFIGACLATLVYARWKKIALWTLADVMAPSIALGSAFGRIGCFLNGCCYGRVCHLPWAVVFPPESRGAPPGVPLHPTELYDSLLNFGFYIFLAWLFRHRKFGGQMFAVYLIGYALLRSFVEIFRGDYPEYYHFLGLRETPAQLVSIGILAAGVALLLILRRLRPRQAPAA
jgi:phosphatidylglycerol---prolipoprotein diacylglyceryl transferase